MDIGFLTKEAVSRLKGVFPALFSRKKSCGLSHAQQPGIKVKGLLDTEFPTDIEQYVCQSGPFRVTT